VPVDVVPYIRSLDLSGNAPLKARLDSTAVNLTSSYAYANGYYPCTRARAALS